MVAGGGVCCVFGVCCVCCLWCVGCVCCLCGVCGVLSVCTLCVVCLVCVVCVVCVVGEGQGPRFLMNYDKGCATLCPVICLLRHVCW